MNPFLFLFTNFEVAFVSDIVLNDLSTHYGIIQSLRPYFYKQSILKCAVAAGITIITALLPTMVAFYLVTGAFVPYNSKTLVQFSILAFILGFVLDILIYKMKIFGNRLDDFYKEFGVGFWGGVAFVFSITISYFIQKNLKYLL
jgi:hypothetical protein